MLTKSLTHGVSFGHSKVFGWNMSVRALATRCNIGRRIKDLNMNCHICSALEDSVIHALLECPLATKIQAASPFPPELWSRRYPSVLDNLMFVLDIWGPDEAGDFLAVLWEVWNSRNYFIFSSPNQTPERLAHRAIAFIHDYREARLAPYASTAIQVRKWVPPPLDIWKLNFDAGQLGEWGRGLGFTVRNSLGDVVFAGSHQFVVFPSL